MTSTKGQMALYYATEKRWPVLPLHSLDEDGLCTCRDRACREPAKHPRLSNSRYKEASRNPAQVMAWWETWPDANVSIATGVRSGVIALDIDKKNGARGFESLALLERRHGALPRTPRSHTGSGGLHIFFRAPSFELRGRIGMRPGIDVKAEDMNCIMPPSKHASGCLYRWDEELGVDFPLADIPAWLVSMIRTKNKPVKRLRYNIAWG